MRCPYCGSKMLYPDSKHKNFSTGKAVAGAVAFGIVGAAAGFIGKDNPGYRCSACGAFTENTMDFAVESAINSAVINAENGDFSVYNELRKKYPNIETIYQNTRNNLAVDNNINNISNNKNASTLQTDNEKISIKNSYYPRVFTKDCPVYVEKVIIKSTPKNDMLSLFAWNISEKVLRSVYFKVKVIDDVGDEISTCTCAYQGLSVASGDKLPLDKEFDLNTDLAYKIEFEIEKAAFDDDNIWRKSEGSINFTLFEQSEILPENFPKYRYLRAILEEKSNLTNADKLFQPIFEDEFTQCICGMPINNNHSCVRCGMNREKLEEVISYEELLAYQYKSIKELSLSRSKVTKKLLSAALTSKYKEAIKLQNDDEMESIDKSIEIFETLGDYKDSKEQIQVSQKNKKILEKKITVKRIAEEKEAEEKRIAEEKEAELIRIAEKKEAERRQNELKKINERNTVIISFAVVISIVLIVARFISIGIKTESIENQLAGNSFYDEDYDYYHFYENGSVRHNDDYYDYHVSIPLIFGKPMIILKEHGYKAKELSVNIDDSGEISSIESYFGNEYIIDED